MTCVLSVTSLYNNPCTPGFSEDGDRIISSPNEDYSCGWISGVKSRQGQVQGLGLAEGSSPGICRIESAQGSVSVGALFDPVANKPGGRLGNKSPTMCNLTPCDDVGLDAKSVKRELKRKLETENPANSNDDEKQDAKRKCDENKVISAKRKLDIEDSFDEIYVPPKRISPFLNTPKERKDERKKILKMSIQKLKKVEDPEHFLRRSVLINNTMKRMQSELREAKKKSPASYAYKRRPYYGYGYDILNNSCLSKSYLFDDPFLSGVHEKITDDMTDTLMNNLKDRLGVNISSDKEKCIVLTPVPEHNSEVNNSSESVIVPNTTESSTTSIEETRVTEETPVPKQDYRTDCDDLGVTNNSQRTSAYIDSETSVIEATDPHIEITESEPENNTSVLEDLIGISECSSVELSSTNTGCENNFVLQSCGFALKTDKSFIHSTSDRINLALHSGSLPDSSVDSTFSCLIRGFGEV